MYDVQAEAEYEALKGLLEWRIQQEQVEERARIQECLNQSTALPKVPPVPVMTRILECINEFTALPRVMGYKEPMFSVKTWMFLAETKACKLLNTENIGPGLP